MNIVEHVMENSIFKFAETELFIFNLSRCILCIKLGETIKNCIHDLSWFNYNFL